MNAREKLAVQMVALRILGMGLVAVKDDPEAIDGLLDDYGRDLLTAGVRAALDDLHLRCESVAAAVASVTAAEVINRLRRGQA